MRHLVFAVALAGVLATSYPVAAEPPTAAGSDQAPAATKATEQPVARRSPPDAAIGLGKDLVAVGFGWG